MNFAKRVSGLIILLASIGSPVIGAEAPETTENQRSVEAAKASEKLLMDIKQAANNRLVAVGERGHILVSDDEGSSWRQVIVPTQSLLTPHFFIDEKVGWAVGHKQVILKTEDAGESWSVQYQNDNLDQPALFDIWFRNSRNGIATGAYGLYLKTDDGGATWEEVYQDSLEDMEIGFPHFYSIAHEKKSGKLFMAAELGMLAVSDDLGD
ncbi:MAG: YCF48-related protein, partial [Kangiellaceae bacterium]|nr:YCF48-related protein [Kangiellaceae bacterium]